MPDHPNIILASGSPRRRQLLALAGLRFTIVRPEVDETPVPNETPPAYARRLSLSKAAEVARRSEPGALVIAADTIVVHQGEIIGKPADEDDAVRILRRLRGQTHHVHTALAVARGEKCTAEITTTAVPMRHYTDDEITAYVTSGDPLDKAGAYGIQHTGFNPVIKLQGCYGNVVGLPLCTLARMLDAFGVAMPGLPEGCRQTPKVCGVEAWPL
jgi:septum formation protein